MAAKKTQAQETAITIPAIDVRFAVLHLAGDSPLIVHKWSEKAKREMLEKQMKKAKKGREAKNPVADFIESLYWLEGEPTQMTEEAFEAAIQNGARFGFPAVAFKASAVAAGFRSGVTKNKTIMNGAFHIDNEYVEIHGIPEMREDMCRVGLGVADIRYRGEFKTWSADVAVKYNSNVVSLEQVVNLFQLGGFACGIGEWRPEKGGRYGMYHVG